MESRETLSGSAKCVSMLRGTQRESQGSAKLSEAINQVESLQELEQMLNEWERG